MHHTVTMTCSSTLEEHAIITCGQRPTLFYSELSAPSWATPFGTLGTTSSNTLLFWQNRVIIHFRVCLYAVGTVFGCVPR